MSPFGAGSRAYCLPRGMPERLVGRGEIDSRKGRRGMMATLATNNDRGTQGNAGLVRRPLSIASVTVLYNGARVLRRHLDSLKEQSRKIDEIIVVNNASNDESLELLAQFYPEVKVLDLSR